jgi:hypothetical protein
MTSLQSILRAARLSADLLANTKRVLEREFVTGEPLIAGLISTEELLEIGVSNEALPIKNALDIIKVLSLSIARF